MASNHQQADLRRLCLALGYGPRTHPTAQLDAWLIRLGLGPAMQQPRPTAAVLIDWLSAGVLYRAALRPFRPKETTTA